MKNSNQTKIKPKQYHKKVLVFGMVLKPNQLQIWTKNEPKNEPIIMYFMYYGVRKYWIRFHWFLVRFWFKFEAGSASKPYQKPVLFYGMVLVWFGAEPKPYQTENIPNRYVYARTHVPIMSTMVLYDIFLNWTLAETDFRRNRCVTIHVPPNCYNGYLHHTIVK